MALHSAETGSSLHITRLEQLASDPVSLNKVATVAGETAFDNSNPDRPVLWSAKSTAAGDWKRVAASGGGVGILEFFAPTTPVKDGVAGEIEVSGLQAWEFDFASSLEIVGMLVVPSDYSAGAQILLKGGLFFTAATSGTVLFRLETRLVQPGTTVATSLGNAYTSTNSAVTISGAANIIRSIGDMDACDSSGEIDSVAIAPGDMIQVRLYRNTATDTASENASMIKQLLVPDFGS